ncbi:MAG: hypothetical protein HYZ53_28385 [Planctomycetes bacterium]|nr:hypothetical protein [Planctomycetota bacterium]
MEPIIVVRGRMSDPRHIELDQPLPGMAGEVGVVVCELHGGSEFWRERTVEELAAEQGATLPQSVDALLGSGANLWESDEDFHAFLACLGRSPAPGGDAP